MELNVIYRDSVIDSEWWSKHNELNTIGFNGVPVNREHYNLIVSKRDLSLYAKGILPTRGWSFNRTKKYFGLKGDAKTVAADITTMLEEYNFIKDNQNK